MDDQERAALMARIAQLEAERNIAVNTAKATTPDFDVVSNRIQIQQRESAERRTRELEAEVEWWEDWSNDLASLLPEDAEGWPGVNPEGAQEAIILEALRHLVDQRRHPYGT